LFITFPSSITGLDYRTGRNMFPSDLELWLLLSVSKYVLLQGDMAFLAETVTLESGETLSVLDLLSYSFEQ
jgi:cellobiose phosphorylase